MSILTQEQTVQNVYIIMYNRGDKELHLSKNDIIDIHTNFRESASGISCAFMIYDGIGIKRYNASVDRDRAYKNQLIGNAMNVGTSVGMKFDVRDKTSGETYYYMTVEVAEHIGDEYYSYETNEVMQYICENIDLEIDVLDELISIFKLLKKAAQFMDISDMHTKNIGYHDGKPIIIDFGEDNVNW